MRAQLTGSGIRIVLYDEDIIRNNLECRLEKFNTIVQLSIVNKVSKKEVLELEGFHIETDGNGLDQSQNIYIELSKDNLNKLVWSDDKWFCSRSRYDRCDVHYRKFD